MSSTTKPDELVSSEEFEEWLTWAHDRTIEAKQRLESMGKEAYNRVKSVFETDEYLSTPYQPTLHAAICKWWTYEEEELCARAKDKLRKQLDAIASLKTVSTANVSMTKCERGIEARSLLLLEERSKCMANFQDMKTAVLRTLEHFEGQDAEDVAYVPSFLGESLLIIQGRINTEDREGLLDDAAFKGQRHQGKEVEGATGTLSQLKSELAELERTIDTWFACEQKPVLKEWVLSAIIMTMDSLTESAKILQMCKPTLDVAQLLTTDGIKDATSQYFRDVAELPDLKSLASQLECELKDRHKALFMLDSLFHKPSTKHEAKRFEPISLLDRELARIRSIGSFVEDTSSMSTSS